ncbi:hypothetical protein KI387_036381 [Taxus chinensis]|uniref:DUF547 domain-containing protein n=1 Tax=Taxus chinensis TaxID=29808 RepID=A0AA38FQQ5_TAXCH|nr:hypothetical protein KI387_036381 [Taxus chinensis]
MQVSLHSMKYSTVSLFCSAPDNYADSNDWEMSTTKDLGQGKETMLLVEEIGLLEEEVTDLEQRLLTFYRMFFSEYISQSPSSHNPEMVSSTCMEDGRKQKYNIFPRVTFRPSSSPSSLHCDDGLTATSYLEKEKPQLVTKTRNTPLSIETSNVNHKSHNLEYQSSPGAEWEERTGLPLIYQNSRVPLKLKDYFYKSPNHLSEELVRCMSAIYCKLSEPPLKHSGIVLSPSSSLSSASISFPHGAASDGWSPKWNTKSSDILLKDPYKVKGDMGDAGPYRTMVEVPGICVDKDRLSYATHMLRNFRSMVEHLEKVDPTAMKQHAKLAFWINIYNALVMHAAYKVGGYSISATAIEQSILCCRTSRPAQWLQRLLSIGTRLKAGEERHTFGRVFGLDVPEPLVCFAICSGGFSDPAVRVYTEKNVINELEMAKREFLLASIGIQNNRRVTIPKLLECFGKEAEMSSRSTLDWVCEHVDDIQREAIKAWIERKPQDTLTHCIEWLPYNGNFRYIFSNLAVRLR